VTTWVGEPYDQGRASRYLKAAQALSAGGVVIAPGGRRSRPASALAGALLASASALTRFGIFEAGK
jgi:hypothetical protein